MNNQAYTCVEPNAINDAVTLKAAVKSAKAVFIQSRFGINEQWVKISKKEASLLLEKLDASTTPQSMEMYAGYFGKIIDGDLYLG